MDGTSEVALEGFTPVLDVVFDAAGNLYVLQIARTSLLAEDLSGVLIRVTPDGAREELVPGELFAPTGLAFDRWRNALYISDCGVCPGEGQVLRLDLPDPDDDDEDDDLDDEDDLFDEDEDDEEDPLDEKEFESEERQP